MSRIITAIQSASLSERRACQALAPGSSKVRLGHSWHTCYTRNLALARLTLQQLRCRASAGLPQWNFSDATIKNTNYGDMLRKNKTRVGQAANNASASWEEKALVIAMAMRETQHMMASERNVTSSGLSATCSALNLNFDMLEKVGYNGNGVSLNDDANLPQAVDLLVKAIHKWGAKRTLDFHCGGSTAFKDGISFGAGDYRNLIQTIYNQLALDQSLLEDDRRVEINIP